MKFFTFYSYKGGVGRSMALANVAEILYRQQKRVVIIDWDLEAPGIEGFFCNVDADVAEIECHPGLIDVLQSYKKIYPRLGLHTRAELQHRLSSLVSQFLIGSTERVLDRDDIQQLVDSYFSMHPERQLLTETLAMLNQATAPQDIVDQLSPIVERYAEAQGREFLQKLDTLPSFLPLLQLLRAPQDDPEAEQAGLWLLSAGMRGDARRYAQAVQEFDWSEFYTGYNGELYFEWLREQLDGFADYVLIDSRTGVTEMGGVCTQHLADVIVFVTAPNPQNVKGVRDMIVSVARDEIKQLRRDRPLQMVVVPSRIDSVELVNRNNFQSQFVTSLSALFGADAADQFWNLRIPYVAYYTYFDMIVVGARSKSMDGLRNSAMAAELEEAYEKLAAHLTGIKIEKQETFAHYAGDGQSPFVGSHPYLERNASTFIGRGKELKEVIQQLNAKHVAIICGARGAGKTSFLHACVLPQILKNSDAFAIKLSCDAYVFSSFVAQLNTELTGRDETKITAETPVSSIVERIVTLTRKGKQLVFAVDDVHPYLVTDELKFFSLVELLVAQIPGAIKVVLVMNTGDVDDLIKNYPALYSRPVTLNIFEESVLRRIITEPLALSGLSFEPGLRERLVNDLADVQPQLVVMQIVLMKLYENRAGETLTHLAYDKFGGVRAVLDDYYKSKTDHLRDSKFVMRVITRLVNTNTGSAVSIRWKDLDEDDRHHLQTYIDSGVISVRKEHSGDGDAHAVSFERWIILTNDRIIHAWPMLKDALTSHEAFLGWRRTLLWKMEVERSIKPGVSSESIVWTEADRKDSKIWVAKHPEFLSRRELKFITTRNRDYSQRKWSERVIVAAVLVLLAVSYFYNSGKGKRDAERYTEIFKQKLELLKTESGSLRRATTCSLANDSNTYNSDFIRIKKDSLFRACVLLQAQMDSLQTSIARKEEKIEREAEGLSQETVGRLVAIDSLEKNLLDKTTRLKIELNDINKNKLRTDSISIQQSIQRLYKVDDQVRQASVQGALFIRDFQTMNKLNHPRSSSSVVSYDSSTWFKEGYYLQFDEARVSLLAILERNIKVKIITLYDGSQGIDSILTLAEGNTAYMPHKEFVYALTLDKIGRAGRNPFTPAAYVTFVKFRREDLKTIP
jgi:MinD-like ATPase involved in chromosome partitioning or flagellar assembly